MQTRELLVRRVPVATDDALIDACQLAFDDVGRARLVQDVMNDRAGVEHPQVPPMPHLARDIGEHRPARLIGMPVGLAAQLQCQRTIQRLEQRCDRLQPAGQGARRDLQPAVGKILDEAMAGAAVEKLVQQHGGPYRNAELAPFDQSCRRRRRHDARHAATPAAGVITLATDDAPVGLDLDLQDFAVLGAGKHAQLQTTLRTLRHIELDALAAPGQSGLHRPTVSCAAGPLPPGRPCQARMRRAFADASAALGLAAEHALLEIADLRVRHLQLGDQHRLALGAVFLELIEKAPVASFPAGVTRDPPVKLRTPVGDVHDQLDVLRLGQRHRRRLEWHRDSAHRVDIGFGQAWRQRHALNGSEEGRMCPAIPEVSLRTASPNVY